MSFKRRSRYRVAGLRAASKGQPFFVFSGQAAGDRSLNSPRRFHGAAQPQPKQISPQRRWQRTERKWPMTN